MRLSGYIVVSASILTLILFATASSQQSSAPSNNPVTLTVTVRTNGGPAIGLTKDAFKVTDNKIARSIDYFEPGDHPASIAILIDTSLSVGYSEPKRLDILGTAIQDFIRAGHQNSEYLLGAFDTDTRFLTDWKSGAELLAEKVPIGQNRKNTALYDACFQVIDHFASAKYDRRVLIVISDGQDNTSRHTFNQIRELLKRTDVVLYAMLASSAGDLGSSLGEEGKSILEELAAITGGDVYLLDSNKQLAPVFNQIAVTILYQYRVGFHPDASDVVGKWRPLKIGVTLPPNAPVEFKKLTIRARKGYYKS